MWFNKKKKNTEEIVDEELIKRIEPRGGITFKNEKHISTGNAYIACINIYEYPKVLKRHWLSKLCNKPNTIAIVDVDTENMEEVVKNIKKSVSEQLSRKDQANSHSERRESQNRVKELDYLYNEISNYGEIMKALRIRIFVANRNLYLLQEQVDKIISKLEVDKFKAAVFLNETKYDFESMFESYKEQEEKPYTLPGQELTASAVAGGNPFHFSCLEDPYGLYLGQTPCGGSVLFDIFAKNDTRLYYNSLIIGVMRSGKSTLLKKQFLQRAILGDFVRAFDITGEFTELTNTLGGKIIACDGTNGIQNPFEILKSSESDNGSFARHISKLATWYKFLVPEASVDQVTIFKNLLYGLYKKFNLLPDGEQKITELSAEYYPIMEDFYIYLQEQMDVIKNTTYDEIERQVKSHELLQLQQMERIFQDLISSYGHIFNGYTSFSNLKDVQIITYDMSKLKEMDDRVFDAQLFNILSTCWDNCVTNGSIMKKLYESGKIKWEDIVHFLILIDESHRWLNVKKLYALNLISIYMREAPKFFGGIMMASQSIRDYVPDATSTVGVDELKKLFELTQYKFIFHQDSSALPLLDKIFENVLTYEQRNRIPRLMKGENILCISGDRNIEFKVYLSKEEERIFTGGV